MRKGKESLALNLCCISFEIPITKQDYPLWCLHQMIALVKTTFLVGTNIIILYIYRRIPKGKASPKVMAT